MTVHIQGQGADRPSSSPIGIFDSGVGGVTVLRELYNQLPQESVVYFGDTARLPYGTRSPQEILTFVQEILGWMASQGVKMVIMACNTSSALALEAVQGQYPFPVLGLILPGAKAAVRQGRRVGVIATPATVASNAYAQAIREANPQAKTWQVACPQFVPLIESNQIHTPQMRSVAQAYLEPLIAQQIDTLIYGCTHYPHLAPVLRTLLDPTVQLINPAVHVVAAAVRELDALGLRHTGPAVPTRFYTSGPPAQFATLATQWLGYRPWVDLLSVAELQTFGGGASFGAYPVRSLSPADSYGHLGASILDSVA
ncbi:MAG: glutamate racemase [Prochlorothrix sp.]|nr:glutamate racemase [Prochlorothrix sp.]